MNTPENNNITEAQKAENAPVDIEIPSDTQPSDNTVDIEIVAEEIPAEVEAEVQVEADEQTPADTEQSEPEPECESEAEDEDVTENTVETSDQDSSDEKPCKESEDAENTKKGKKAWKIICISLACLLLAAIAAFAVWYFTGIKPIQSVTLEAGEELTCDMFFEGEVPQKVVFVPDISEIPTDVVGEYEFSIKMGLRTHKSVLVIEDTTPPLVSVRANTKVWTTELPHPSYFIADVYDVTGVTLVWSDKPVLKLEDNYIGEITVSDASGNTAVVQVNFLLVFDTEPPVIDGIYEIEAFVGSDAPDYTNGIILTDDKCETEEIILEVDSSLVDTATEGKYAVTFKATDRAGNTAQKETTVNVINDTTPPVISGAVDCYITLGADFDVNTYISVKDNRDKEVKVEITADIDSSTFGKYPVKVYAEDFSGNASQKEFTVTVATDTIPPRITTTDIWVYEGDSVSYRKSVAVSDNFYGTPKLKVDSSQVNLNETGSYIVKYTATDDSGNTSSAQAPVYVIKRPSTEELVNKMADDILLKITTEDMSVLEKIYSVYNWVNKNVRYIGTSDKSSHIAGAYEGLSTGKGDCYTYYAVARVFLDRLGVENVEMMRVTTKDRHFWNLVNLGDGWYHYDCSYFTTGNQLLFMLTDEEIYAWDDLYYKAEHRFDTSLSYPERATESMQYVVNYSAKKIVQPVRPKDDTDTQ